MPAKSWRESILELFRANPKHPFTKSEIARELNVPPAARAKMRESLDALVKTGEITFGKKALYQLRAAAGTQLTGSLKFLPKGQAFFFPDLSDETNLASGIDFTAHSRIILGRRDCGIALDGDDHIIDLADILRGQGTDQDALLRQDADEPLLLQAEAGLMDRRAAGAETPRQFLRGKLHAGREFGTDDRILEGDIGLLDQRQAAFACGHCRASCCQGHARPSL